VSWISLGVSKLPYLSLMIVSHVFHCLSMFAPAIVKSLSEFHPGFSSLREPFPSLAGLTLAW
jgi:hypothetical protein